jgi:nitroreductase
MTVTHTATLPVREAVEDRRSIRRYTDDPIPREDLDEILRLVSLAPSAWNVQPWRFHVVTDPGLKQKLQEAAYGQKQVGNAPAVIMVCSDMEDVMANTAAIAHPGMAPEAQQRLVDTVQNAFRDRSVKERGMWGLTQTNIALGYLMIIARSMGYGTVPMLGFDQGKVRELLGLPEHVEFAAMVPIGVPAEPGFSHHRHGLDQIVTYH